MKRSEINKALKELEKMIADHQYYLPKFANFTPEEWKTKGHEFDEIRDNMLGWDITDYGMGDFDKYGFSLFTIRNGNIKMKDNYKKMGLDCLVILGGNGTHKTANLLSEEGLNVVTMPKTIDNDVWGTEMTFGFQSAVDIATEVIDCIHTTATSHGRIFIVEVMGHKVGWLNLYAGIAGGADIILLPEIPYDIDEIAKVIEKREQAGKRFSILAVAEGAISKEEAKMKKKELKALRASMPYPSISYKIAKELEEVTGHEIRVTVPGHFQRGGSPCAYDRFLCTRFGAAAARLIKNEQYGFMVALQNEKIVPVPLGEVAGKLKKVPVDSDIIEAAKEIGISFGD